MAAPEAYEEYCAKGPALVSGSFAAQQRLALWERESTVLANVDREPYPKMARIFLCVQHGVAHAIQIVKMTRVPHPPSAGEFIGNFVRLESFLDMLKALEPKAPNLLAHWPKKPDTTFAIEAGTSALDVTWKFARRILGGCVIGRSLHRVPCHGSPYDTDLATGECGPHIQAWATCAYREIRENTLPPEEIWPKIGEIHRDGNCIQYQLHDEYVRAVAAKANQRAMLFTGEKAMDPNEPLVFISYARPDARVVSAIDALLTDAGLRTWFDKKDLKGGEDWELVIRQRIAEAAIVVVCLSTCAVDRKGYFHKEMRYAVSEAGKLPKGKVFVIPVRIDDCPIPDDLQQWHVIDLFEKQGSHDLLTSVGRALNSGVRARIEAHNSLYRKVHESPFSLGEGEAYPYPTKLMGADRCLYSVEVSEMILGGNSAKFFLRVRKHVVGRPTETTHEDSHGLSTGEDFVFAAPWKISLQAVDKLKAYFLIESA